LSSPSPSICQEKRAVSSGPSPQPSPLRPSAQAAHLQAARVNNLVADAALHELLLEVLRVFVLIHLPAKCTRDRVRQPGLQKESSSETRARWDSVPPSLFLSPTARTTGKGPTIPQESNLVVALRPRRAADSPLSTAGGRRTASCGQGHQTSSCPCNSGTCRTRPACKPCIFGTAPASAWRLTRWERPSA